MSPENTKILMSKRRQRNEQAKMTASNVLTTPKHSRDYIMSEGSGSATNQQKRQINGPKPMIMDLLRSDTNEPETARKGNFMMTTENSLHNSSM